jgi:uncharacterized secreted protein with C-terminal beta-propeller domain
VRRTLALIALIALAAAAAPADAARRAKTPRLKAFRSCAGLVSYARRHAPPPTVPRLVPIDGGGEDGGAVPAPAPVTAPGSSSTTNVQETGVDEPDIVKSADGTVFALVDNALRAIDARSPVPRVRDVVHLPGYEGELLIAGRRALAITTGGPGTVLSEVDIADPAHLRIVRTLSVDGLYVSARLHGHTARVVVSSYPRALRVPFIGPPHPIPVEAARAARRPLRARRAGWVPSATLRNRRTGRTRKRALVACDDVRRTPRFTGADMLTVLTIDLAKGLPAVDSDAVMTSADTVYASPTSLYVAVNGGWERNDTSIHRFDLTGADRTDYRASGQVPGDLLNQFSMSEYQGVLRVATTDSSGAKSQSFVTALQPHSGRLEKIGQVGGLGQGERIYAVRFIEDRGYVVTFRQIDPLFTLDLADPAHPRVRGELEIAGYSAYLHPVGPHQLLGVGQDATPQGTQAGTQLSLFDVADPAAPKLLSKVRLGRFTSSDAEYDHHAFLWWEPLRLAVIPVSGDDGTTEARAFTVDHGRITPAGSSHANGDVLRTLVVAGRLLTLSDHALSVYDPATLAPGPAARF